MLYSPRVMDTQMDTWVGGPVLSYGHSTNELSDKPGAIQVRGSIPLVGSSLFNRLGKRYS